MDAVLCEYQHSQRPDQLRRRDADDDAKPGGQRDRLDEHPAKHARPKGRFTRAKVAHDQEQPEQNNGGHEYRRTTLAGDGRERLPEHHIGAVPQLASGLRERRGEQFVCDKQRQREQHAVTRRPAEREIG